MENTNVDEKKESQELKNIKYKTMLFNGYSDTLIGRPRI
jgi:hypothetical protein